MIDEIALFVHIVQNRGLAAAAEQLNLPPATVTRRLQKLESTLGCQLIHRSARKFNLTAEGEVYYQAYADLVLQFEATSRNLSADIHQLTGKLTVLAPTNVSVKVLQPMWSAFIKLYPEIQLHLYLSNETKDIMADQVDMALRIGPQVDSQLFQKKIGLVSTILVASPEYLFANGTPQGLNALQDHRLIAVSTLPVWRLKNTETGLEENLHPLADTMVNDIGMASQLARDGHGVVLLPLSEMVNELQQGQLQRVLSPWCGPEREIFAVWPTGRLLSTRAKCLRDFMQAYLGKHPVLQGALGIN
ncbi:LysR family transcriptional regulator [Kiloniella antarctica]|uniref:LysR family transcriptional regulator n=1 Tax=Kiloniella antarctica TaxID=1550907 RepID=A0ABW5BKS0_9PROT